MPRRHYLKVPTVKGRDFAQVEPLSKSDDARVHDLKPQGRIGSEQLSHPAESCGVASMTRSSLAAMAAQNKAATLGAAPALRVSEQMADLSDRQ